MVLDGEVEGKEVGDVPGLENRAELLEFHGSF
jgi:hypothetical protein